METISPPKFLPSAPPTTSTCPLNTPSEQWSEILVSNCHFGLSTFLAVLKDLCLHPERNSNLILRADGLPLKGIKDEEIPRYGAATGDDRDKSQRMEVVEEIRVRLMPRQPNRDGKLDQRCLFFRTPRPSDGVERHTVGGPGSAPGHEAERSEVRAPEHEALDGLDYGSTLGPAGSTRQQAYVIYAPEVSSRADQPFYYPPVRKLAYRYETLLPAEAAAAQEKVVQAESEKRREARRNEKARQRSKAIARVKAKMKAGIEVDDQEQILIQDTSGSGMEEEDEDSAEDDVELDTPPIVGRITIAYLPWDDPPPVDGRVNGAVRPAQPKKRSPLAGTAEAAATDQAVSSLANLSLDSTPPSDAQIAEAREKEREKLYRVCLNLLERVYRCGFGQMMGYQKRMNHDVVVPRDAFQDLYLKLKDRHRHLESRKPNPKARIAKEEDVKRHVYKSIRTDVSLPHDPPLPSSSLTLSPNSRLSSLDRIRNTGILPDNGHTTDISDWGGQDVAIAAFLMLLWRDMYPSRGNLSNGNGTATNVDGERREWDSWGRPAGGFVDLGCGNGLLVHVLTAEGYAGKGYELRARRTWPTYPPATQANLVELPIDFPSWFPQTIEEWDSGAWPGMDECAIKEGCFIIGNHADEITPWIPLLSLIPPTPTPFLSLPCCTHTLDSTFTRAVFTPPPHPHSPPGGLDEGLEKGQSKYKAYLMYLGHQGLMCGWEWEKEGLRVPSTRGWGIVGRNRWTKTPEELRECRTWALEQVQGVRTRGAFQVRVKEGKDH